MGRSADPVDGWIASAAKAGRKRAALPYDGVMGELPPWLSDHAEQFGRIRADLIAATGEKDPAIAHRVAVDWVLDEAARLMGIREHSHALPPRVRRIVNQLAAWRCAVELGKEKGLSYLMGEDAAYGVRTADGRKRQVDGRERAGKKTGTQRKELGERNARRVMEAFRRISQTCPRREVAGKIFAALEKPKLSLSRIRAILRAEEKRA